MGRSIKYKKWLLEQLKDPILAIEYLKVSLEEDIIHDKDDQKLFCTALKYVLEAQTIKEADGFKKKKKVN